MCVTGLRIAGGGMILSAPNNDWKCAMIYEVTLRGDLDNPMFTFTEPPMLPVVGDLVAFADANGSHNYEVVRRIFEFDEDSDPECRGVYLTVKRSDVERG